MQDTTSQQVPFLVRPLVLAGLAGGILVAATVALWAKYGTAVFVDMVVSGLNACF
jgi:hypothetical protein